MAKGKGRGSGRGKAGKTTSARKTAAKTAAPRRVASSARDPDEEFDTPEKAYAEAEYLIAAAQASHATELDVELRYLTSIPPSIAGLTALQRLSLDGTQVTDLAPLAGLGDLQTLSLTGTQVTDLAPLAGLGDLQTLWLDGTQVTDLAPLARLTALQMLSLTGTQVADLAPLAGLGDLQTLWLDGTQVTDLAPLAGLSALQYLWLTGTQVADLAPLARLTALQTLSLTGTQVADLAPLARLTALQHLWLTGTQVADLAPLARLTALQTLSLTGTQVVDLAPLARLTALQTLSLTGTQVADLAPLAGLTALQTLSLTGTHVADLGPLARMTTMMDNVHRAWSDEKKSYQRSSVGLSFESTPVARKAPFIRYVELSDPDRTIKTINELRRRQGLPEYRPGQTQPEADPPPAPEASDARVPGPPEIPPPRPAAIEPVWRDGKLTLPTEPAAGDLDKPDLDSALKALKQRIERLVEDIKADPSITNSIDKTFVRFLEVIADKIPNTAPPQHVLFDLGHELETLQQYAPTVTEMWPAFPAAQYHAMVLAYGKTVGQFPRWREMGSNALSEALDAVEAAAGKEVVSSTSIALRASDAGFVEAALPEGIDNVISPPVVLLEPVTTAVGTSSRLHDALESVNNTLKEIAQAALDSRIVALGSAAVRGVGSAMTNAGAALVRGINAVGGAVGRGLTKAGPKLLKKIERDSEKAPLAAYEWLKKHGKKILAATGTGIVAAKFGWLSQVLEYLFR